MREWVPAEPANTFSRRATATYWRLLFLTRHNVWFKNVFRDEAKKIHHGALLHSVDQHPISVCTRHMLFEKGYPVKDGRCKVDTCFICYPSNELRQRALDRARR
jgi:hypothetical protein